MNTTGFIWPKNEKLVFLRPPKEEYHGNLDFFYSPDLFPELAPLKENWKQIRDEILEFEKKFGNLSGMTSVNPAKYKSEGGNWTLIYLMNFRVLFHKNRKRFPFTSSIVDKVPNAVFAAISILPPNTELALHYGDTNGVQRTHLGLIIPAGHPTCTMKVGPEEMGWKEGELMSFVSVQKHTAWNKSSERRYVLIVDIIPKPLQHRTTEICTKGLGTQTFHFLYKKFSIVRNMPVFTYPVMCTLFRAIWWVCLPIQRRVRVFL